MQQLTDRQKQVLDYITERQQMQGETPSMREIAEHFGFRSMNAARDHIRALCRKGALEQAPRQARSLRTVSPLESLRQPVLDIPVFGDIPAGFSDNRQQEAIGCVSVDVKTLGLRQSSNLFALKVRGDSMTGRHIDDGDFVICQHEVEPRPGDVVAADAHTRDAQGGGVRAGEPQRCW
ncbi:MAG: S24 family peptidase, partial [Verrucomicrobiota bacterium]